MKKLYMFFVAVLMLAGCAANQNMPAEYCGTFKGTLPAASGPGIETTIQLNRDYSFSGTGRLYRRKGRHIQQSGVLYG